MVEERESVHCLPSYSLTILPFTRNNCNLSLSRSFLKVERVQGWKSYMGTCPLVHNLFVNGYRISEAKSALIA